MKGGFFTKLAFTGIKKNKKLYLPYILTCIGMILMYYIITSLSYSPLLEEMKGGYNVKVVLILGKFVIAIFSLIFLFYTNSFLMRRRNKEFGLYNILGMNKRNVSRIIAAESVFIALVSFVAGLGLGIAFSKLAELGLLNVLHVDIVYKFSVSVKAILEALGIYFAIFFLLFLNSFRQVHMTKPLELLHSENIGEKPPKANWVMAVIGLIILGIAYFIAVTIKSPLTALFLYFIAVVMVIIATYLLFTAGSVALCKLLQKNKKYYYKKNHYISVSSMTYRMKRNGAGLASICILSTMVLVMISGCFSLYIGEEDSMNARFPRDISVELQLDKSDDLSDENLDLFRDASKIAANSKNSTPKNILDYRYANISGLKSGNKIITDDKNINSFTLNYDDITYIVIMPLSDFNRMMRETLSLNEGEAAILCNRTDYKEDTIKIGTADSLNIVKHLDSKVENGQVYSMVLPTIFVIVKDISSYCQPLEKLTDSSGEKALIYKWSYYYDLDGDADTKKAVSFDTADKIRQLNIDGKCQGYYCDGKENNREDFYTTFGGLFFIGILLSIVFLFATVLIIYYKQVCEGYEDQSKFDIMQKVGMTKTDIKKSINSQVLTVFFAPLILSGIHLSFSFSMMWKVLQIFNLFNVNLVMIVSICSFLIFAIFYIIVYRITSNSYYSIVSGAKK